MPYATIAEETLMLCPDGWRRPNGVDSSFSVLGVDRHGRLAESTISLQRRDAAEPLCLVVSEEAAALLPARSTFLARGGARITAGGLVQDGASSELWFESVLPLASCHPGDGAGGGLWDSLLGWAAFSSNETIALRCRLGLAQEDTKRVRMLKKGEALVFMDCGRARFAVLDREKLLKAFKAKWLETVLGIVEATAVDPDSELPTFEIGAHVLAQWYLLALGHDGQPWRLSCDSLQHTLFLQVAAGAHDGVRGLARSQCACMAAREAAIWRATWELAGWNPIAGGFILAPD